MASVTEDLNDFAFTQIPSRSDGGLQQSAQCIVRDTLIRHIKSYPGYPSFPAQPDAICYRIGPSQHGNGMFAVRHLPMGNLILSERPLTLTPTYLRTTEIENELEGLSSEECRRQVMHRSWEQKYLRPLVCRLDPDDRAAFMALANCHSDSGVGEILGVIRTNGLDPVGLVDPVTGDQYAAVCKTLSRINHSCNPSAHTLFDLASFTFQLRATRDIQEGEEIFISYCYVLDLASVRQEDLADWKFACTCKSCSSYIEESDQRRLEIERSVSMTDLNFESWLQDPKIPNDFTIQINLYWLSVIEMEGLESTDAYRLHLGALVDAYVALGILEKATEYGQKLGRSCLAQSGRDDVLCRLQDESYLRRRPDWMVRKGK